LIEQPVRGDLLLALAAVIGRPLPAAHLRADLDVWIAEYNERRPHRGRWCSG
jgi:hypothetical protein